MERESFSPSCCRAAASGVHHLARLPAGGAAVPGRILRLSSPLAPKQVGSSGGERALIALCGKSKPSLDPVPEATLLGVTRLSQGR